MAIKSPEHETDLLAKTAQGDEHAFTTLFHWYSRPLGEFVIKLTHSLDITEEIIQDVFVIIWQRREKLLSISNFSSYLYILCRNHTFLVLKKMASEKAQQASFEADYQMDAWLDTLDNPADHYRGLIEKAVDRLPFQQKTVFMLSRYERLKTEEIAKKLQLSPDTVKKHLQLANKTLRNQLGDHINPALFMLLTTSLLLG